MSKSKVRNRKLKSSFRSSYSDSESSDDESETGKEIVAHPLLVNDPGTSDEKSARSSVTVWSNSEQTPFVDLIYDTSKESGVKDNTLFIETPENILSTNVQVFSESDTSWSPISVRHVRTFNESVDEDVLVENDACHLVHRTQQGTLFLEKERNQFRIDRSSNNAIVYNRSVIPGIVIESSSFPEKLRILYSLSKEGSGSESVSAIPQYSLHFHEAGAKIDGEVDFSLTGHWFLRNDTCASLNADVNVVKRERLSSPPPQAPKKKKNAAGKSLSFFSSASSYSSSKFNPSRVRDNMVEFQLKGGKSLHLQAKSVRQFAFLNAEHVKGYLRCVLRFQSDDENNTSVDSITGAWSKASFGTERKSTCSEFELSFLNQGKGQAQGASDAASSSSKKKNKKSVQRGNPAFEQGSAGLGLSLPSSPIALFAPVPALRPVNSASLTCGEGSPTLVHNGASRSDLQMPFTAVNAPVKLIIPGHHSVWRADRLQSSFEHVDGKIIEKISVIVYGRDVSDSLTPSYFNETAEQLERKAAAAVAAADESDDGDDTTEKKTNKKKAAAPDDEEADISAKNPAATGYRLYVSETKPRSANGVISDISLKVKESKKRDVRSVRCFSEADPFHARCSLFQILLPSKKSAALLSYTLTYETGEEVEQVNENNGGDEKSNGAGGSSDPVSRSISKKKTQKKSASSSNQSGGFLGSFFSGSSNK